ncbi:MAG: hypothetical protein JW839_05865 [Candidatus Lokiarchaeota archaeon]|nr:hypothetical protein [Candidatus Lokiarchaeota archaeon]
MVVNEKKKLADPAPEARGQLQDASTGPGPSKGGADPHDIVKQCARSILLKSSLDVHWFDGFLPKTDEKGEFASIIALRRAATLLSSAAAKDVLPLIRDFAVLMTAISQNPMIIPRLLEAIEATHEKQRMMELAVKKALAGFVAKADQAPELEDAGDAAPTRNGRAQSLPESPYT